MNNKFYIIICIILGSCNHSHPNITDNNVVKKKYDNEIYEKVLFIDSFEFYSKMIKPKKLTNGVFKKINGKIKIPSKDSFFTFKDNLSNENYFEYSFVGQVKSRNWNFVLGNDYQQSYYYLISENYNKIDSLVGYPLIFGDKIICKEEEYTDCPNYIEIWNINKNSITLNKKFPMSTNLRSINITDLYLKDSLIFIRNKNYNHETHIEYMRINITQVKNNIRY
ncbi:MAG: hypothetical protein H7321_08275 [Bacteroidia bacterium]|nr:hypothetical protein [Bacteroidia bacterium]